MAEVSHVNAIYAVPDKGPSSIEYINDRKFWTERNQPQSQSHSLTPLMMTNELNVCNISNGVDYSNNNNNSDMLPPPVHKKPTRVFRKQLKDDNKVSEPNAGSENKGERKYQKSEWHCPPRGEGREGEEDTYKDFYLTPTDPPQYSESEHPLSYEFSCSPTSDTSDNETLSHGCRSFYRFDSGVGDCESERGSGSLRAVGDSSLHMENPRLSTHYEEHYEDIDQYKKSHQLQPRNSTDKMEVNQLQSLSRNTRPFPQVQLAGVTHSDSEDSGLHVVLNSSIAETVSPSRDNRTSERLPCVASLPHAYSPLNVREFQKNYPTKNANRGVCALVIVLLLIFFVSAAALSLSIYLLLSRTDDPVNVASLQSTDMPSPAEVQWLQVQELQNEVALMKQENAELKSELLLLQANLTLNIQPIEQDIAVLFSGQNNISLTMSSTAALLQSQISNLSLTPEPQYPIGVANYSLCSYKSNVATEAASSTLLTKTRFFPPLDILQDEFVTFAFCTLRGAVSSSLVIQPVGKGSSMYQYSCTCSGKTEEQYTHCTLHYWTCPRIDRLVP